MPVKPAAKVFKTGGMTIRELYKDRREAGKILGGELESIQSRRRLLVLGLPRGGVVVANEVASALDAEFDVLVVRKIGVPGREEVAMGAIASGGVEFLNDVLIHAGAA